MPANPTEKDIVIDDILYSILLQTLTTETSPSLTASVLPTSIQNEISNFQVFSPMNFLEILNDAKWILYLKFAAFSVFNFWKINFVAVDASSESKLFDIIPPIPNRFEKFWNSFFIIFIKLIFCKCMKFIF